MRYPIFGIGLEGKSRPVTAQRRLNLYMDVQPQEDKALYTLHPTPGLLLFASFGTGPIRGMHTVGELMYVVHAGTFWEVNNSGTKTSRGSLNTTSGRVDIRDNHAGQVMVTDGTNGYIYDISGTSFNAITDGDYNDTSETVEYHDGYFITPKPDSGEFYLSQADSASWDHTDGWIATDFATAEKSPDDLVRVFDNTTEIMLCGEETIEFWSNTGASDFPYERVSGGVIELGLASKWAISRFDESSVMLLARNSNQGDVKVIRIEGFQYTDVSLGSEFETVINDYGTVSDASAFSYVKQGHPFWQLNFPTAGKSWLYDGKTKLWSELEYGTLGARHRAEMGTNFLGKYYVGDYEDGKIYELKAGTYTDNGELVAREFISRHIFDERYVQIARLWLDMNEGDAPVASNPQIMLQVSKDGGRTWGAEKWRAMGRAGKYLQRIIWRRLGRAYNWTFKIRIVADVKTVFIGSWVDTVG